jgi:hypothetical protein
MNLFDNSYRKIKAGRLVSFSYSPGYSDMEGAFHRDTLEKNGEGNWVVVCRERGSIDEPECVTTCSVSDADALRFEQFIKKRRILSLSKRLKSPVFLTDYSPWSAEMVFDCLGSGGNRRITVRLEQYRIYTRPDLKRIDEMTDMFYDLLGDVISVYDGYEDFYGDDE